ncbi:hypothetical protein Ct61P_08897 [Colletotrichum tofieldiae]|nr:hypothetical protein Ct61P_08897 [Colletotrichum tofieldiae]
MSSVEPLESHDTPSEEEPAPAAVEEPTAEEPEMSLQNTPETAAEEIPAEAPSDVIVTEQLVPEEDITPGTEASESTSEEPTEKSSLDEESVPTDAATEEAASDGTVLEDAAPEESAIPEEAAAPEEAVSAEESAAAATPEVATEDTTSQEPTTEDCITEEVAPIESTEPAVAEPASEATEQTREALDTAPEIVPEEAALAETTPEDMALEDPVAADAATEEPASDAAASEEPTPPEPIPADPVPESTPKDCSTEDVSTEAAPEETEEQLKEDTPPAPEAEDATPKEPVPTSEETALPAENGDSYNDTLIAGTAAAGVGVAGGLLAANIGEDSSDDKTAMDISESNEADAISRRNSSDKLTQTLASTPPSGPIAMADQKDADVDANFNPVQREGFSDSGTQTDSSVWSLRPSTPAVVLPELPMSPAAKERAKALRRQRKASIKQAEELVAAAVVIYATVEALRSPTSHSSQRSTQIIKAMPSWEQQMKIKPKKAFFSRKRRMQRLVTSTGDAATPLLTTHHPILVAVEARTKAETKADAIRITRIIPADGIERTANGLSDPANLPLARHRDLQRDRTAASQKAHRLSLSEDIAASEASAVSAAGGLRGASAAVALSARPRNKLPMTAARKSAELRVRRRRSVNVKLLNKSETVSETVSGTVNATGVVRGNANRELEREAEEAERPRPKGKEPEVFTKPEETTERGHRRSRRHSTAEHHRPERTLSKRDTRGPSPGKTKKFFSINGEVTKDDMPMDDNAGQQEATGSRGTPKRSSTTREKHSHSHSHSHTRRSEDVGRSHKLQKARDKVAEEAARKAAEKPRTKHSDDSRRRAREEERRKTRDVDKEREREREREKEKEKSSGIKGMFKRLFN